MVVDVQHMKVCEVIRGLRTVSYQCALVSDARKLHARVPAICWRSMGSLVGMTVHKLFNQIHAAIQRTSRHYMAIEG